MFPPSLVVASPVDLYTITVKKEIIMAMKTAFVNEMILKTLKQHQQTVPPAVQKAAS